MLQPLRLLLKNRQFLTVFQNQGKHPFVTREQLKCLENFTCLLYGDKSKGDDLYKLRYSMFMSKFIPKRQLMSSDVGMSLLPPFTALFHSHVLRVNYQVLVWNFANQANPDLPRPHEGHGWLLEDGKLLFQ